MKIGDIIKLVGVLVAITAAVFGAIMYFTPRAETAEVRHLAGMTQQELSTFRVDMQIKENKRQLRDIEIEEVRPGTTPQMKAVFDRQKRSIRDEIEMLEKQKKQIR